MAVAVAVAVVVAVAAAVAMAVTVILTVHFRAARLEGARVPASILRVLHYKQGGSVGS